MNAILSAIPQSRSAVLPHAVADRLQAARARTLLLTAPVSEADLARQHDPLMGPILWDLGHIAAFEELWLVRNLAGAVRFSEMPGIYNPFEHPRAGRGALQLPSLASTLEQMALTRSRVLAALARADLNSDDPLLHNGYIYALVVQHECQHQETILQTLQLKQGAPYRAPRAVVLPSARLQVPDGMVRFPGGPVQLGTSDWSVAYDNERPLHEVVLRPFAIDVHPVTNREYQQFMEAGGYRRRELWSDEGWDWLRQANVTSPKYWERYAGEWHRRCMDLWLPADNDEPVCHVNWHEAEAYARWAGKRLPTEAEWEAAATWDPVAGTRRLYPWGDVPPSMLHANLDQLAFRTAPVGAFPANISPIGCYGMIGDVWEWTASSFAPYPGFDAYPYQEYSTPFFGPEYRVLRGGSWATCPNAIRGTFRNWDYPIRRQIFSGFRCAVDD